MIKKEILCHSIIETGGKQYKVSASKILEIEKLTPKLGRPLNLKRITLNIDKETEWGSIEGASVEAKLLDNVKDRTILYFIKKKKHSKKKMVIDNVIQKYK